MLHKTQSAQRRYALADKMLALSIFYQSRKAYRILSKLFALPSKKTLQRAMQKTNIMPGFVTFIFEALKLKVDSMEQKEKYVALVFDEMSLKTSLVYNSGLDKIEGFEDFGESNSPFIADHALVFMVRGLLSKWKQPLAYFLTAGTVTADKLQQLTRNCIDRIEQIGLHTKVLICDQGSNNRCFLQKHEKVSIYRPYILYKEHKVFVMYDPPHLLKNIRNNFIRSDYKYDDVDVKWSYVVEFYNRDKLMSIRMAPKLTDKHINLPPFSAMRVNLAAQILSHSVAAGINVLCNLKYLPEDASATAEFIETFDQLFNSFNSARHISSQKYKSALSNQSGHIAFLQSCLKFLSKLKTREGSVIPCFIGWQLTIRSLLELWEDLQQCGFSYLFINRLNQDCVENLFSAIRFAGGFRDNPNPQQFRAAFRNIIVYKLFLFNMSGNCELDTDKMLLDIANITVLQKNRRLPEKVPSNIEPMTVIAPAPSLEKRNVVAYMAGYLIKKFPVNDCLMCKQIYQIQDLPESSSFSQYELLRFKRYTDTSKLTLPTSTFTTFVQTLEDTFCSLFGGVMHFNSVLKVLCSTADNEVMLFNKCGKEDCMKRLRKCVQLFMSVRIHHALKTSHIGTTYGHKKNRKMLKLCHE